MLFIIFDFTYISIGKLSFSGTYPVKYSHAWFFKWKFIKNLLYLLNQKHYIIFTSIYSLIIEIIEIQLSD